MPDDKDKSKPGALFIFLVAVGWAQALMAADQTYDLIAYGESLPIQIWPYYVIPVTVILALSLSGMKAVGVFTSFKRAQLLPAGVVMVYLASIAALNIYHGQKTSFVLLAAAVMGMAYVLYKTYYRPGPFLNVAMALIVTGAACINLQLSPEEYLGFSKVANFGIEIGITLLFVSFIVLLLQWAEVRTAHLVAANAFLLIALAFTSLLWTPAYGVATEEAFTDPPLVTKKPSKHRPNVVLIVFDTLRRDRLSLYGYERKTSPCLDEFSQEAVVYRNVYSVTNWTMPAHCSLFTGKFPRSHGAARWGNYLSNDQMTLAEILKEIGYRCGAVSANSAWVNRRMGMGQGFDFFCRQNPALTALQHCDMINMFIYLSGRADSEKYLVSYLPGRYVNKIALQWIRNQRQPWFLFLNYMEAHANWYPPPEHRGLFPGRRFDTVQIDNEFIDMNEYRDHLNSQYDAEVYTLDRYFNQLISSLEEMGLLKNTLVVVTSDHGTLLGEHSQWGHFRSSTEEEFRIPLIVRYPGAEKRGEVTGPVQIHDVFLIILNALGITPDDVGDKYYAYINDISEQRNRLLARNVMLFEFAYQGEIFINKNGTSMIKRRDKLILYPDGIEALYDLENDPGENNDLAGELPDLLAELKREHDQHWSAVPKAASPVRAEKPDRKMLRLFRDLGYIK